MKKQNILLIITLVFILLLNISSSLNADSLNINTDLRVRGISYTNNDFDKSTKADGLSYYSQRLMLSLVGQFAPNIEIGSKLTALGVGGGTKTALAIPVSHTNYTPESTPFPNTNLTPYIENAYIKLTNVINRTDIPIDVTIGKQKVDFGNGRIFSDNGMGYFALYASGSYYKPFPWYAKVFTAKIEENLYNKSDHTVYGIIGDLDFNIPYLKKKHYIELGFMQDRDNSGTQYIQGASAITTNSIAKQFISLRFGRSEKLMAYEFEYVMQNGTIKKSDLTEVKLKGFSYVLSGRLMAQQTKLGKVTARALLSICSGDDNPLSLTDDDEAFSPSLTRKYDGLERIGYGTLFAATPQESFFVLHNEFSGICTLNVGADFSPWYGWDMSVEYFLFSATQGPNDAPATSGFERMFNAAYSLGIEMDLRAKYTISKFIETRFSYSRYTPPNMEMYQPRNPATRYHLEITTRF